MKKLLALLLAIVTVSSVTTTAFAATRYVLDKSGLVTINTESMDGGSNFQPGITYTLPLVIGDNAFSETEAEIYKLSGKVTANKDLISSFTISKGADGNYYAKIIAKKKGDQYGQTADFTVQIIAQEKGISSKDAKITSQGEIDRITGDSSRYEVEGSGALKIGDVIYFKEISEETFTIGYPDVVYINDDSYEVENDNPIALASGISRSTLKFGSVAEFDAKFGSTDKRFNLGYSTATNASVVANNGNADLVFINFTGKPTFAANADLRIMNSDMKYLYEIDGTKLVELDTNKSGTYIAYRTQTLRNYVASDVKLTGDVTSSSSSSKPTSSSSSSSASTSGSSSVYVPPVNVKPNPDTGR